MLFVCNPNILHKHCLQFLLGVNMAPRETENNACAKFWGDKQRTLWYVTVFFGVVNCLSVTDIGKSGSKRTSKVLTLSRLKEIQIIHCPRRHQSYIGWRQSKRNQNNSVWSETDWKRRNSRKFHKWTKKLFPTTGRRRRNSVWQCFQENLFLFNLNISMKPVKKGFVLEMQIKSYVALFSWHVHEYA